MSILLTAYRIKNKLAPDLKLCHLPLAGPFFSKILTQLRLKQAAAGVKTEVGIFATDDIDSLGILRNGDYGKPERMLFAKLIKPNSCVLDVGANIGFFSVFFSKLVSPGGIVHSFEPSPGIFKILARNLLLNQSNNVKSHMIAAGERDSSTKLFLNQTNSGDNRFFADTASPDSIDCLICKLDDLPELKTTRVDFIKMDVQGYEFFALKGLEAIIQRSPDIRIFCEFWPYGLASNNTAPDKLFELLQGFGFKIYDFNHGKGLKLLNHSADLAYLTPESKDFTDLVCSRTPLQ